MNESVESDPDPGDDPSDPARAMARRNIPRPMGPGSGECWSIPGGGPIANSSARGVAGVEGTDATAPCRPVAAPAVSPPRLEQVPAGSSPPTAEPDLEDPSCRAGTLPGSLFASLRSRSNGEEGAVSPAEPFEVGGSEPPPNTAGVAGRAGATCLEGRWSRCWTPVRLLSLLLLLLSLLLLR